jgi:hypothetical protein
MKIKAIFLLAGLAGACVGLRAGDPPYATHDELTAAWRSEDYRTTVLHGLTCDIFAEEDVPVFTTEGCGRHFPGESRGVCESCLMRPEMEQQLLSAGLSHSHTLADGTTHQCTVSPMDILAFLEARAEAASALQEVNADLRSARKRLAKSRSRSQIRQLRRQVRSLEARRVGLLDATAGMAARMAPWVPTLRRSLEARASAKAELDALPFICGTCGKYPQAKRAWVEKLASLTMMWTYSCPGCGTTQTLNNVDACSKTTCNRCLTLSGEATRVCVVCRQTERGQRLVFPGKPGMAHGTHCLDLMRKYKNDSGKVGSFDVCQGHEEFEEPLEESKGDGKASAHGGPASLACGDRNPLEIQHISNYKN